MTPIPAHLALLPWYPGHCAWVLATYGACRHVPPVGTAPVRAVLTGAVLTGAVLTGADFSGADFSDADFRDADLTDAILTGAYLRDADLTDAVLTGADGILAIGPVGAEGRIIYGVRHASGPMVQAGCFWGRPAKVRAAIASRYADGTGWEQYRAGYLAAIDRIEAWAAGVDP